MPPLATAFQVEINRALALAGAGETLHTALVGTSFSGHLSVFRLQLIYEMAYLHVFVNWENLLEEAFIRYLSGYRCSSGRLSLVSGRYTPDLSSARKLLFGTRHFLLWHDAGRVIGRSQRHFRAGLHEVVLTSNLARMDYFSNVRHYIAHKHADARAGFDAACMNLAGRRYRGSRPGAFLRDVTVVRATNVRWLTVISDELASLAHQIVP